MYLSQFIALRYLRANSRRSFVAFINLFSIAGISLGLAALIVVLSVMNGLEAQLKQRILGILPHIVVEQPVQAFSSSSPDVTAVSAYIETEVIIQSRSELKGVLLQGIDASVEKQLSIVADKMISGDFNSLKPGQYNLIVSSLLATQMQVRLGDKIRLISPQTSVYSPLGRVPSQRLFTITGIFNLVSEMDDKVILADANDVARLTRKRPSEALQTRLFLNDAFSLASISQELEQNQVRYVTWQARQGALFEAVKMEKNMMALMLALVVFVAGFNVISALVMVVAEKTGDISILLTQGMLPTQIMQIFFFNGFYNALIGTLIGTSLGFIALFSLNPLLSLLGSSLAFGENGQGLPILINQPQLFMIAFLTVGLCALTSLYPARKAAKIQPSRGLSNE